LDQFLKIHSNHWREMLADVTIRAPIEACGLVAGQNNRSTKVYPLTNELQSPVRFQIAASEQIDAFMEIERNGWDLLAIYHSHPTGPDRPSETDLAEFAYPETLYLIWHFANQSWDCKAFRITENGDVEVPIQLING